MSQQEELKIIISADANDAKKDLSDVNTSLDKVGTTSTKSSASFKKGMKSISSACKTGVKVVAGVTASVTALGAGALALASKTASTADEIDKMSQRLGLSTKGYQELDYALGQAGVDITSMQTSMKQLTKNMDKCKNGGEDATEMFKTLGVDVTDANGNFRDQEDVLKDVIRGFEKMEDGTDKARLAQDLFGKQGQEMLPLLNAESGTFDELCQKASDLGMIMSDDAVSAGVEFTDTMDTMKRSLGAIVTQISANTLPIFNNLMNWVIDNLPTIKEVFQNVFGVVQQVLQTAWSIVEAILPTLQTLFTTVFESIKVVIDNAMDANIFEILCNVFDVVINTISEIWTSIGQPIFELMQEIFGIVVDFFRENFDYIMLYAKTCFDYFKTIYNSIFKPIFDLMISIVKKFVDLFKSKFDTISTIFKDVVTTISTQWNTNLKPVFEKIGDFITNVLKPIFDKVFTYGIVPIFEAFVTTITNLWNNSLKPIFEGICEFLNGVFTLNFGKAFEGLAKVIKGAFEGLTDVLKAPFRAIANMWNNSLGKINFELPSWLPGGLGGKSFGFPKIPEFAKGGVVENDTLARIGEAGREAVVPLENNTEWTSEVASLLNGAMGNNNQPLNITLKVGQTVFGKVAIDSINNLNRQNGEMLIDMQYA